MRTSVVVDNFAWLESRAMTESRRSGSMQATGTDGMPPGAPAEPAEIATDDLPF